MSVVVWLCGYSQGVHRSNKHQRLPRPPWFSERLRSCGLDPDQSLEVTQRAHAPCDVTIEALVRLANIKVWEGPLTNWAPEAQLLRQYLALPDDAYDVSIDRCVVLKTGVRILTTLNHDVNRRRLRAGDGLGPSKARGKGSGRARMCSNSARIVLEQCSNNSGRARKCSNSARNVLE